MVTVDIAVVFCHVHTCYILMLPHLAGLYPVVSAHKPLKLKNVSMQIYLSTI